jgi:hypothetical protein
MSAIAALSPQAVLHNYFRAKDANRPHLMAHVLTPDAQLEVTNRADSIAFPSFTQGREAIAQVLVSGFGQVYENVYSFYMQRPPALADAWSCDWLVAMSEKEGGRVRVGCGRYDWSFQAEGPRLANRLHITIERMELLPPRDLTAVMDWVAGLPYPWCDSSLAVGSAPGLAQLRPITRYLGKAPE